MKQRKTWKNGLAALALAGVCLGTGAALAAGAGSAGDPLVSLSYLEQTVLPDLLRKTEEKAQARQNELTAKFNQLLAEHGGGGTPSATYTVVTLAPNQRMNLNLGCEVMLRVGSATAWAAENPALVDTTNGSNLDSGSTLVKNHLYMSTMTDHYIVAGGSTVKVLVRGGYSLV